MMNTYVISSVLCWNYRGISNANCQNCLRELISKHNPQIWCIVETRANEERCHRFCREMTKNWDCASLPSQACWGGIIAFWRKNIGMVTLLGMSQNVIHLVICSNSLDGWILSVVYNP